MQVRVGQAVRTLLATRHGEHAVIPPASDGQPSKRCMQYERARDLSEGGRPVLVKESVFQLVPGVSSSWSSGVRQAVWRHGYWHVARSQVKTKFIFTCSANTRA